LSEQGGFGIATSIVRQLSSAGNKLETEGNRKSARKIMNEIG
jgi:Rod binding domain-containing protein